MRASLVCLVFCNPAISDGLSGRPEVSITECSGVACKSALARGCC